MQGDNEELTSLMMENCLETWLRIVFNHCAESSNHVTSCIVPLLFVMLVIAWVYLSISYKQIPTRNKHIAAFKPQSTVWYKCGCYAVRIIFTETMTQRSRAIIMKILAFSLTLSCLVAAAYGRLPASHHYSPPIIGDWLLKIGKWQLTIDNCQLMIHKWQVTIDKWNWPIDDWWSKIHNWCLTIHIFMLSPIVGLPWVLPI